MITVGPQHQDVLTLHDWTTLVQWAERRTELHPTVLHALFLNGAAVVPADLAGELRDFKTLLTHAENEPHRDQLLAILDDALRRVA